jgi:hypothetical protein
MNYKQLTKVVYDTDVSILDYLILLNIYYRSEEEFLTDDRFKGNLTYLQHQGYLGLNNKLTPEGKNFIEFEIGIPSYEQKVNSDFYVELHKKLQDRLIELTGKKQHVIQGKYSFLCNSKDIQKKLSKVITSYGLKDLNRVEKVLLNYVSKCVKARFDRVQLIEYFIMKDNVSALVTQYENYEDEEENNRIESTEEGVYLV